MEDPTHDSVINKSPSPESNSVAGGGSVSKKVRSKRRVFTGVEKELLVERYKGDKLNDKKSRQGKRLSLTTKSRQDLNTK